jgi:hypothetical protein
VIACSVWDKSKRKSKRRIIERIGMRDPNTGEIFYKEKYLEKLKKEGQPTDNLKIWVDNRRAKQ